MGMGETRHQRAGLLEQLAILNPHPESVPINLLIQVPGTSQGTSLAPAVAPAPAPASAPASSPNQPHQEQEQEQDVQLARHASGLISERHPSVGARFGTAEWNEAMAHNSKVPRLEHSLKP